MMVDQVNPWDCIFVQFSFSPLTNRQIEGNAIKMKSYGKVVIIFAICQNGMCLLSGIIT